MCKMIFIFTCMDVYYCTGKYYETNKNNESESLLIHLEEFIGLSQVLLMRKAGWKIVGMMWYNISKRTYLPVFVDIISNGRYEYSCMCVLHTIIWIQRKCEKVCHRREEKEEDRRVRKRTSKVSNTFPSVGK